MNNDVLTTELDDAPSKPKRRARKPSKRPAVMPFGKYAGVALTELPEWYLDWITRQTFVHDPLRSKLQAEEKARSKP